MKQKKIILQEGMVNAALTTYNHDPILSKEDRVRTILEAALRWQSENPREPTLDEWKKCTQSLPRHLFICDLHFEIAICMEWQRQMFFSLEPEDPEVPKVPE